MINEVAGAHGVSGAQVSLAWLLQRPAVASVIIGGRTTAQFEDNLKAADLKLTADDVAKLDKVSQPPLGLTPTGTRALPRRIAWAADLVLHKPYMSDRNAVRVACRPHNPERCRHVFLMKFRTVIN